MLQVHEYGARDAAPMCNYEWNDAVDDYYAVTVDAPGYSEATGHITTGTDCSGEHTGYLLVTLQSH